MTPEISEDSLEVEGLREIQLEDLLRENSLLNMLPVAVCICNADGIIKKYNIQAIKLWGRVPVLGDKDERFCGAWRLYQPDGTPLLHASGPAAACLADGQPRHNVELIMERPDLSRISVVVNIAPITDPEGKVTGMINCFHEVAKTASRENCVNEDHHESVKILSNAHNSFRELNFSLEKKVEERTADLNLIIEELRLSEERYHKMVEEVEDYAIVLLSKEGIIQNWNRGAERIKGYREAEVIGKHFRIFYTQEEREKHLPEKLIDQAVQLGKALHEGWRVRKNGTRFWASIVITALHDSHNNVIGFTKVTRDLTERKLAEEKINQYNLDLEFQNRELEQFAYAAAHDMKEPLRKIRFYNNLLLETAANLLPEKEREYLERSIAAATRMQKLIDDLLTYSRMTPRSYECIQVDLEGCFREVLAMHHETIQDTNAIIESHNLPVINGIHFQVLQLLDNLVGNALKYRHPERTPHIRIKTSVKNGTDLYNRNADNNVQYLELTIEDNGIGFDARYADKIFDLFQRLHDKANYSGTGIGLAICRKVMQNHKGFITAHGEPGKGATFTVYFPVQQLC
jgi:PAS domain S-box